MFTYNADLFCLSFVKTSIKLNVKFGKSYSPFEYRLKL